MSQVAPRVGAWIETTTDPQKLASYKSHPVWVRGLKQRPYQTLARALRVAPRVGAWIETRA